MTQNSKGMLKEYNIVCPDCNVKMRLRGRARPLYKCPDCKGTLAAGAKGKPKGVPGTKAVRALRQQAHVAFDRFWKSETVTRSGAQKWLTQELGMKPHRCHFSYMDEESLHRIIQICDAARLRRAPGPRAEDLDPATKDCRGMANEALGALLSGGANKGTLKGWVTYHTETNGKSIGEFNIEECRRLIDTCRAAMKGQVCLPRGVQGFSEKTRKKNIEKFGAYLGRMHSP